MEGCSENQDWRPQGNVRNAKVRMSNMIASNTAVLIRMALRFRPSTVVAIEQPKGSFMFKQDYFQELLKNHAMFVVLTYLGLFGLDLLKGTHIWTNAPILAYRQI